MNTLNGLPKSWDSFIQGICTRRKLISFSKLREECAQEEVVTQDCQRSRQSMNAFGKEMHKERM